jgi:chromosomal replication initiation ATPase DnaA
MPRPLDRPAEAAARFAADLLAFNLGLEAEAILARRRGPPRVTIARHLVMYLLGASFEMSLAQIALALKRDRSTISYGIRAVESRRDDPRFDHWLQELEDTLRKAPAAAPYFAEGAR